jgi:hypothetical protein
MGAEATNVICSVLFPSSVEERVSTPDLAVELPKSGNLSMPRPDSICWPRIRASQPAYGSVIPVPPPVTGCRTGASTGLAPVAFTTPPAALVTAPPMPFTVPTAVWATPPTVEATPEDATPTTGSAASGVVAGRCEVTAPAEGADDEALPVETDEAPPVEPVELIGWFC